MIVSVKELFQKRKSGVADGKTSHTRSWQVISDNVLDGTAAALCAEGIPHWADPGPSNTTVSGITAEPVKESDVIFEVTVEFTGGTVDEIPVHPLDRPPEYSWPGQDVTEPYFLDKSKPPKPFCNTAGDSFESTWERNTSELSIQMVRNEAVWDVLQNEQLADTTNANVEFLDAQGYAPGTLLMALPTATKVSEVWMGQTINYYKVTRNFKAKSDGWKDKPLDVGYNTARDTTKIIDGVSTAVKERIPIVDAAGLKIARPWPLDGHGKAKPSATDTPEELEFLPYDSVSWAALYLS